MTGLLQSGFCRQNGSQASRSRGRCWRWAAPTASTFLSLWTPVARGVKACSDFGETLIAMIRLLSCLFRQNGSLASRSAEGGAGGGQCPPPAPPSAYERLRREQSERAPTVETEKPW